MIGLLERFTQNEIGQRYEQLREQMTRNPVYGHLWQKFDEVIVRIPSREGPINLFATLDAHYFFNESTLIAPFANLRFYNAVPGFLTGLGILGTFVGLTIGLAQIDLGSTDINVLKKGIVGLLNGAAIAFSTSVWGMSLSIAFSIFEKYHLKFLHREISRLQQAIDRVFVRRSPESWLAESLRENREQTSELKKFNTDLAISIATALDEKMAGRLSPALTQLISAVDELKQFKSESSTEAIRNLAEEFHQNLARSANEEIVHLSDVLGRVSGTLEGTVERSEENQRRLESSLDNHLGNLAETVTGLMETISRQQHTVSNQTQNAFVELLERMERSLGSQQERIENISIRAQAELLEAVRQVSESISGLLGSLRQQTDRTSVEMTDRLMALSSILDENIRNVTGRYQEERSEIGSLLANFQNALSRMEEATEGIALAGEAFGTTASPVREATVALNQTISEFRRAHEAFASTVTQSQDRSLQQIQTANEVLAHMRDALDSTRLSWEAYREKFGELRENLNEVFTDLNRGLTEYSHITKESLSEYLQALDDNLTKAVGTLSAAIESLDDTVSDLGNRLRRA